MTPPPRKFRVRAGVGTALIILGMLFMVGAFFVPPTELLRDPELIPMPERLLGLWAIAVGVLLLLPLRRRPRSSRRSDASGGQG